MEKLITSIRSATQKFGIAANTEAAEIAINYLRGSQNLMDYDACLFVTPETYTGKLGQIQISKNKKIIGDEELRLFAANKKHTADMISNRNDCLGFAVYATGETIKIAVHGNSYTELCECDILQNYDSKIIAADSTMIAESILSFINYHLDSFCNIPTWIVDSKRSKSSSTWKNFNQYVEFNWQNAYNKNSYIFPGSFDPIHAGHLKIAEHIYKNTGEKVSLEISMLNVSKKPIDHITVENRIKNIFLKNSPAIDQVFVTKAARFHEKVKIFPGSTFLIGEDTLERILVPVYHEDKTEYNKSLEFIANNAKLMVFNRQGCKTIEVPEVLKDICEFIPLSQYEDDGISSTKLRNQKCNFQ